MGGTFSRRGRDKKCIQTLVGKFGGNRQLGRPRRRWEDDIIMDLMEIRWRVVDWIHIAQVNDLWCAVVNTVMNLWFTQIAEKHELQLASQEGLCSME
jgi:hypothetical protein